MAFAVEPVRVEQSTDFDRLVLDIETDGSHLAARGAGLGRRHPALLVGLVADLEDEPQGLELGDVGHRPPAARPTSTCAIEDLDLSERPRNCLKRAQINTIGELVERTADDLLAITNFGQKSARRGHPAPRRAGPVAAHQGLSRPCVAPPRGAAGRR